MKIYWLPVNLHTHKLDDWYGHQWFTECVCGMWMCQDKCVNNRHRVIIYRYIGACNSTREHIHKITIFLELFFKKSAFILYYRQKSKYWRHLNFITILQCCTCTVQHLLSPTTELINRSATASWWPVYYK